MEGSGRYSGGAFHESFERGKSAGEIRLTSAALVFETGSTRVEFPLGGGLEIKAGGASDRLLFFSHPARPGWTVYTSDRSILKDPILGDFPDLAGQIGRVRARKHRARLVALVVLLLLGGVLLGLYLLKEPVVGVIVRQVPPEWEQELGEMAFGQIGGGKSFIEDEKILADLEKLTAPLLEAIQDRRYDFEFHIMEDASLNAFALPGGHVTLHTGLILKADGPGEVVGVLAHEIAHVTRQHSLRQMVSSAGLVLILQALLGDATGILALLKENSSLLLARKFSRDYERDADEKGWEYLHGAGIDPRGMVGFFRKIRAEAEKLSGDMPLEEALSLLGTHPATQERIDRLMEKWEEQEEKGPFIEFDLDFEAFQESIRNYRK